jgi:hypothetical protein
VLSVLCLLVGIPVSAATVRASTDMGSAIPKPSGSSVLDRALAGDETLGNKNFDMLLEMRRNEVTEAGRPVSPPLARQAARAPAVLSGTAQPAPMAALLEVEHSELRALIKSGIADVDETLGLPKGTTVQTAREWLGSGGAGDVSAGPQMPAGAEQRAPGAPPEVSPLLALIGQVIQGVRDYSYWLLGAAALALALGAAFKKFSRRI